MKVRAYTSNHIGEEITSKLSKRVPGKKAFVVLLALLWTHETLLHYFTIVVAKVPIIGFLLQSITAPVLMGGCALLAIPYISKFIKTKEIVLSLIIVIVSLCTWAFNTKYSEPFGNIIVAFLIGCVPLYFVGKALINEIQNESEMWFLYNLSLLSVISTILVCYISGFTLEAEWSSNMSIPYILLPHMLLILAFTFEKVTPINIAVFLIGLVFMLFLGNRGSLVCLLTYILILVIHSYRASKLNKKITMLIAAVAIALFVAMTNMYDTIIAYLYTTALKSGLSVRVFDFVTGSMQNSDSGRSVIQVSLLKAIKANPFGYGLAADQYLVGSYSHNIIIEFWVEYGVFIGTFLAVIIIFLLFSALKNKAFDWPVKRVLWLLICVGFVKLFISGTYLTEPYFYVLLGLCANLSPTRLHALRK